VDDALGLVIDHFNKKFDCGLKAPRHARRCGACGLPKKEASGDA